MTDKKRIKCPLCKGTGKCTVFSWGGGTMSATCLTCFGLGVIIAADAGRSNGDGI